MRRLQIKVGDSVCCWGVGFPVAYYTPGVVGKVYEQNGQVLVDWSNTQVAFAAVPVENLTIFEAAAADKFVDNCL